MMILCEFGSFHPIRRIQGWALERLISLHCVSGDLRWAVMALSVRALRSVWAVGREQFVRLVRVAAGREPKDADTMVAAGRG